MSRAERRKRVRRPLPTEVRSAGHQPEQYTMERTLQQFGEFAAGVNRADGWKRSAGKVLVVLFLLGPILIGMLSLLLTLL